MVACPCSRTYTMLGASPSRRRAPKQWSTLATSTSSRRPRCCGMCQPLHLGIGGRLSGRGGGSTMPRPQLTACAPPRDPSTSSLHHIRLKLPPAYAQGEKHLSTGLLGCSRTRGRARVASVGTCTSEGQRSDGRKQGGPLSRGPPPATRCDPRLTPVSASLGLLFHFYVVRFIG